MQGECTSLESGAEVQGTQVDSLSGERWRGADFECEQEELFLVSQLSGASDLLRSGEALKDFKQDG